MHLTVDLTWKRFSSGINIFNLLLINKKIAIADFLKYFNLKSNLQQLFVCHWIERKVHIYVKLKGKWPFIADKITQMSFMTVYVYFILWETKRFKIRYQQKLLPKTIILVSTVIYTKGP